MRKLSLLVSAALLASLASVPADAAKRDNTIRFAYDQAPENVDPFFNNVRVGVIIAHHVWDNLVYRDPNTGEYKGQLATGWKQVDDKTIDFDLRQGVKFHNGEEFDADDVVYTLNFVAKPESKVVTQQNVSWIAKAEKLDKYKVRLTTKDVLPAAIEYLAGPVVIHPNEYYEKVGPKGMNEKPVGTGPYRVTQHALGKSITLERNPDYFKDPPKPQPKIAKVEIRFIPDRQTQMAEILSSGLDFTMHVPKDQADQMGAMPNLQIVSGETMRIVFMQPNSQDGTPFPMLKDERVRRAIIHSIDRQSMVKQIVGEGARVLNTICFPSQFGCTDEGAPRYAYDPALAKKLLAEAGFPNGFTVDIVAYRERNQTEALIGYLKAVGIRAELKFLQYAAMRDIVRGNKSGLSHQTWGSFSVNDMSASTPVYYNMGEQDVNRDPEIRDLLNKGDNSVDPNARKEAYRKGLALLAERAYGVPLWSLPVYYAASSDLVFKAYPDELPRFWEMSWKYKTTRMVGFVLKRLGLALLVALAVSLISFFLLRLSGDVATAIAGEGARSEDIEMVRKTYGLDRPLIVQYGEWLGKTLSGDFGTSLYFKSDVVGLVLEKLPTTLMLAFFSLLFALALAIPLGVLAAVFANRWIDRVALSVAVVGQALPNFFFALILIIVFSIQLRWLPVSGSGTWLHFVMPTIALGYYAAPALMRLVRAGMVEVLAADYIRTARAKGLSSGSVVFKHALRNAFVPVVALAAVQLGFLLGGSVVVETIFALDGVGYLAYQSISNKDFPVTQTVVMLLSVAYVFLTLAADVVNAWLDPRIRVA